MGKRKNKENSNTEAKGKDKANDNGRAKASKNKVKQEGPKRQKKNTTHTDTHKTTRKLALTFDDDALDESIFDYLGSHTTLHPSSPSPSVPPPVLSAQQEEDDGKMPVEEDNKGHHQHTPSVSSLPFSQTDPEYGQVLASLAQSGVPVENEELQIMLTQPSQIFPPSPSSSPTLPSPSSPVSVIHTPTDPLDPVANLKNLGFSLVHALALERDKADGDEGDDHGDDLPDLPQALGKSSVHRTSPSIFILPTQSALIVRPALLECNIVFNARVRCFLCIHSKCFKIVGVENLSLHIGPTTHNEYQLYTNKEVRDRAVDEALSLCTLLKLEDKEVTSQAVLRVYNQLGSSLHQPSQPVEGLPIYQGFCCPACTSKAYIYESTRTLRQSHFKTDHAEEGLRAADAQKVHYQSLSEDSPCLIDKTMPRVVVLPPFAAVMDAGVSADCKVADKEHQDGCNGESAAEFAKRIVSSRLAPRVVAGGTSEFHTPGQTTTLAQPEDRRLTDLLLNKVGFLHVFGDDTNTMMKPLWEAAQPAGDCPWSSTLVNMEVLIQDIITLYMEQGINGRIMSDLSFVYRGAIGQVADDDNDRGRGRGRHFTSVEAKTIRKYANDVQRLGLMVFRQASYPLHLQQALHDDAERTRLDDFHQMLPPLSHEVTNAVEALVKVLTDFALQKDPAFASAIPRPLDTTHAGGAAGKRPQAYATVIRDFSSASLADARPLLEATHNLARTLFFREYYPRDTPSTCVIQRFLLARSFSPATGFASLDGLYSQCTSLKFAIKGTVFFQLVPPWQGERLPVDCNALIAFIKPDDFVNAKLFTVSPFRWVVELGSYARSLSQSKPIVPKVTIASGSTDMKLLMVGPQNQKLDFDKVLEVIPATQKEMVASLEVLLEGVPLEVKSRLHLARDLKGITPASEPYKIFSNMQSKVVGYNFTRDPRAEDLRLVSAQVTEAIIRHRGWQIESRSSADAASMWAWVERLDQLMLLFLFRNHLTSGPPPRAPEHAAIQLARTERCYHQVHILEPSGVEDCHTALIIPMHNKVNQLLMTLRITPRTLDPFASRFLVDYMSVLRPLYEVLLSNARGPKAVDEDALYVNQGRRLTDSKVRSVIEEGFRSHGIPGITISSYRQGITVWMRNYIPPLLQEYDQLGSLPPTVRQYYQNAFAEKSADLEDEVDQTLDILAGHTSRTALQAYGRHDQDHTVLTASSLHKYAQMCQIFRRMYNCDEGLFTRLQQKIYNDIRSQFPVVGQCNVGAGSVEGVFGGGEHIEQTTTSIVVHHGASSGAFPGGILTASSTSSSGACAPSFPTTASLEQQGIILANLASLLRTNHPSFRSQDQAMAFYAMWQVKNNVLVVLPAGGGKSLLFILLAKLLWRSKFVVVIVPLRGLADDLVRRGRDMGVQAWGWQEFVSLWENDRESLMGGLLVLQHEYCHGDERFVMFMNWAWEQQRLFAAVFDEVHLFHLYGTSFRSNDLITPTLLPPGMPVIALSATLPPSMEGRVAHHLRLENSAFERVYRTPTLAKHMRYEVVCEEHASSESAAEQVFIKHLDRVTQEYMDGCDDGQRASAVEDGEGKKAKRRGIVFFNSKKTLSDRARLVESVSDKKMRVFIFHGLSDDKVYDAALRLKAEQERAQALEEFMKEEDDDGRCKWLFATSAGGTGIDLQGVRVVVIYEWCYGMLELYQMLGRCRAPIDPSLPCLGLILTSTWAIVGLKKRIAEEKRKGLQQNDSEKDKALRLQAMEALREFLESQRPEAGASGTGRKCIRHDLEEFNTGTGITCITAGAELCTVCCDILKKTRYRVGLHEPNTNTLTDPRPAPQHMHHNHKNKHLHQQQQHPSHTTHHQKHLQQLGQRHHHGIHGLEHQLPASVPPYKPNAPSLPSQYQVSTSQTPALSRGTPSPHLPTSLRGAQNVGGTLHASSSSSSLTLTARQQSATAMRVNECIAILKELGQDDNLLHACFHCLVASGYKWGEGGEDPSKQHSASLLGIREFILACPQFHPGGHLYNKCTSCLQPAQKGHNCKARGKGGWIYKARIGSHCCPCCQLRDMPCFKMTDFHAKPDYAFGPPKTGKLDSTAEQVVRDEPKGCKLVNTDMYIATAVDLWAFKPDLMHFLLRNSVSYRRFWNSIFGGDGAKQYDVDPVPLDRFYEWLYGSWFTQGGAPIRNCHALFILFVQVSNKGKRKLPTDDNELRRFEEILDVTLREQEEGTGGEEVLKG